MQLTWDKGYTDYQDKARWQPRYEKLILFAEGLNVQDAAQFPDNQLLDSMERLEELMRYFCVENDMRNLEPVMRKFSSIMDICRSRRITGVEVLYLEMLFLRLNALLYRAHGQHRQGADHYDKCLELARKCLNALKKATHLSSEQVFFVGWNCVECWKEASQAHDMVMDTGVTVQLMHEVVSVIQWLDKYLVDNPGICDQASELYASAAGVFYQNGDFSAGDDCYRQAIRLLNALDAVHGSDFYRARAIWLLGVHGTMAFLAVQDANIMLQCEKEAAEYLAQRPGAEMRDRAIAEGAMATVTLQRSIAFQQNGNLPEAIRMIKNSIAALERGVDILQADYADRQGYYRMVLSNIAGRIYNMRVSAMESLGIMYYQNGDIDDSENTLKAVLEELTKTTGLHMSGSSSVVVQAEVLQYLGLIASDRGDPYQADFYGTQAADMAYSLGKESGQSNGWILAVGSCSLVAEVALNMKNKSKAASYAQMGLDACEMLERLDPKHPYLALRGNLVKFKKKASRRFF